MLDAAIERRWRCEGYIIYPYYRRFYDEIMLRHTWALFFYCKALGGVSASLKVGLQERVYRVCHQPLLSEHSICDFAPLEWVGLLFRFVTSLLLPAISCHPSRLGVLRRDCPNCQNRCCGLACKLLMACHAVLDPLARYFAGHM